jgi:hypothetical protein
MKILIASALIIMAGVAYGAESTASTPTLAESCWNLNVGSMGVGHVYLLASIAKQYPIIAGDIQPVIEQMHLSPDERAKICKQVHSVSQVQG